MTRRPATTHGHVLRDGKPVAVRVPPGSLDEPTTIRENVILSAIARRIFR